jgi:hypothetical protein
MTASVKSGVRRVISGEALSLALASSAASGWPG